MLLDRVNNLASHVTKELKNINGLSKVRGVGTQIGFNLDSEDRSLNLLKYIRKSGISVNWAGPEGVGLNPSLIFDYKHADEFLSVVKRGMKEI